MAYDFYTEDLSEFGSRERAMAGELLSADLPRNFNGSGVRVAFNKNSGNVFLVNNDYQVAMMDGHIMKIFYSTPYHGHEGFIDELLNDYEPKDMNDEDCEYVLDIADQEGEDLPEVWQKYKDGEEIER